jgi:hypothetical protein
MVGLSLLYDLKTPLQVFLTLWGEVARVWVLLKESHDVLISPLSEHLEVIILIEPTVILEEAPKGVQELVLGEQAVNHLVVLLREIVLWVLGSTIILEQLTTAHHGKLVGEVREIGVLKVRLDLTLKRPNKIEVIDGDVVGHGGFSLVREGGLGGEIKPHSVYKIKGGSSLPQNYPP